MKPAEQPAPQTANGPAVVGGEAERAKAKAETALGPLVVHCDISVEAARKRAFENLLDAHGVAWRRQGDGSQLANANEQLAKKDRGGAELKSVASNAMAEPDLIYLSAEATPAQIEATLAGLAAQPDVFRSIAITREQDKRLSGTVLLVEDQKLSDKLRFEDAKTSGHPSNAPVSAMARGAKTGTAPLGFAYQQKVQAGRVGFGQRAGKPLDMVMQDRALSQAQQLPAQQHVLFVLRVVGSDHFPAQNK